MIGDPSLGSRPVREIKGPDDAVFKGQVTGERLTDLCAGRVHREPEIGKRKDKKKDRQ
jgi:hypothetical protein